jgi:hypothetical protein
MLAGEFAAGYPYIVEPEVLHEGNHSTAIRDAQAWSHRLGIILHDSLRGETPDLTEAVGELNSYRHWANGPFRYGAPDMLATLPLPDRRRARNEINFHSLNRHLLPFWTPILQGRWPTAEGAIRWLVPAQDFLAMEGLGYYRARQDYADKEGSHRLYDPDNEDALAAFTGYLQEYDAAQVLLDTIRRNHSLSIIPAPWQFQHGAESGRNVNYIVVDFAEQRAVGVQVGTNIRKADIEKADPERVVFIDGTVDLGNVKAVRIQKTTSRERVVPWPGIISAKRVDSIRIHGTHTAHLRGQQIAVAAKKALARQLVGNVRVDYTDLAKKIGDRILAKL